MLGFILCNKKLGCVWNKCGWWRQCRVSVVLKSQGNKHTYMQEKVRHYDWECIFPWERGVLCLCNTQNPGADTGNLAYITNPVESISWNPIKVIVMLMTQRSRKPVLVPQQNFKKKGSFDTKLLVENTSVWCKDRRKLDSRSDPVDCRGCWSELSHAGWGGQLHRGQFERRSERVTAKSKICGMIGDVIVWECVKAEMTKEAEQQDELTRPTETESETHLL